MLHRSLRLFCHKGNELIIGHGMRLRCRNPQRCGWDVWKKPKSRSTMKYDWSTITMCAPLIKHGARTHAYACTLAKKWKLKNSSSRGNWSRWRIISLPNKLIFFSYSAFSAEEGNKYQLPHIYHSSFFPFLSPSTHIPSLIIFSIRFKLFFTPPYLFFSLYLPPHLPSTHSPPQQIFSALVKKNIPYPRMGFLPDSRFILDDRVFHLFRACLKIWETI